VRQAMFRRALAMAEENLEVDSDVVLEELEKLDRERAPQAGGR
jgi:hypothetical protein